MSKGVIWASEYSLGPQIWGPGGAPLDPLLGYNRNNAVSPTGVAMRILTIAVSSGSRISISIKMVGCVFFLFCFFYCENENFLGEKVKPTIT